MAKTKAPSIPDTHVLKRLMEEYQVMLRDAERAVEKILALNPKTEEFWDELSESSALFTLVGDRSNSVWEEITDLIDQLPEE